MNAPGIHRVKLSFEQGFTRIPNAWLRDPKLGFRAKGLLSYLLSHEDGYLITLGQIERETGDGLAAIRSAIAELEDSGYLITNRTHDERGYNAGLSWTLCDPNPECENPTLENPTLENRTAYREEHLIEKKTIKRTNAQTSFEPEFQEFWSYYPRKVGKLAAKKAFDKAYGDYGPMVLEGVRRLAHDPNLPPTKFMPHPATWLNEGRWEDEPYPERQLTLEELKAKQRQEIEERRERQRVSLMATLEESRIAREQASPAPKCKHSKTLAACVPCSKEIASQ